jgi:Zn-dependent protease with chaperone function
VAVAVGALIGGVTIFNTGFSLVRRPRMTELAFAVTQDEQPQLWKVILDIAAGLQARPPTNVILAFDTSFYATAADVVVFNRDKALSGETLCLSLPFLRVLTNQESAGIIGHELGHFSGKDTAYTLKFVPIYSDLSRAIHDAGIDEGWSSLALLPAVALM